MWIHCTLRSPRSLTLRPWQNLSSLTHPRIVQPHPSHAYKYRSRPVVSHSFVTNPLVSPDHLFPHSSAARCLTLSMSSPTLRCQGYSEQLTTSGSCGQASTKMIGIGHAPAFSANEKRHTNTPLTPTGHFPAPGAGLSHVHINLVGPLSLCTGFTYLLTCVDRFTHWPEAIPLPDISAPAVAQAFVTGWIACFGVPYNKADHPVHQTR